MVQGKLSPLTRPPPSSVRVAWLQQLRCSAVTSEKARKESHSGITGTHSFLKAAIYAITTQLAGEAPVHSAPPSCVIVTFLSSRPRRQPSTGGALFPFKASPATRGIREKGRPPHRVGTENAVAPRKIRRQDGNWMRCPRKHGNDRAEMCLITTGIARRLWHQHRSHCFVKKCRGTFPSFLPVSTTEPGPD